MTARIFFYVLYFLSPVLPILSVYFSNPDKYQNPYFAASLIFGATAYTWLVFEFILIARPKFIEKYFGMDKLYRFHGLMAMIAVSLAFLHETALDHLVRDHYVKEPGDLAWNIFTIVIVVTIVVMVDSFLVKLKPIQWTRKLTARLHLFKYELFIIIHNATAVALVFMLVHVLRTTAAKESLMTRTVYISYFAVGMFCYLYHRFFGRMLLKRNIFTVRSVEKESPNTWSVKFFPEKGKGLQFRPGQFGFFRILNRGLLSEEHPFSISSAPAADGSITATIKELGDFTTTTGTIATGCRALIDAPYGMFSYLNFPDEKNTFLISGGVGITPSLSMLRHMHSKDSDRNVVLVWGANNQSDLIHPDEFAQMQKNMKNFRLMPVLFRDESWSGEKGVIDQTKIEKILSQCGYNIDETGFYLCGPSPMVSIVLSALKRIGIPRKRIHFEKFSM
jgi:predicted ferric reductase